MNKEEEKALVAPSAPQVPTKQIGLVLSFTMVLDGEADTMIASGKYLDQFHLQVAKLARDHFPFLTHTLASRQDYFPGNAEAK